MTETSSPKSGNAMDDVAAKLGGISLSGDTTRKNPWKKATGWHRDDLLNLIRSLFLKDKAALALKRPCL